MYYLFEWHSIFAASSELCHFGNLQPRNGILCTLFWNAFPYLMILCMSDKPMMKCHSIIDFHGKTQNFQYNFHGELYPKTTFEMSFVETNTEVYITMQFALKLEQKHFRDQNQFALSPLQSIDKFSHPCYRRQHFNRANILFANEH